MKKVAFLAVIALFGLAATGYAQSNAATNLLDSPYKVEAEVSTAGESLFCTALIMGGTGALFEADQVFGTSPVQFINDELFSPFRVAQFDENCLQLTSWTNAFTTGLTQTGIVVDEPLGGTSVWVVDPLGTFSILEFAFGTGAALAGAVPLPVQPGFVLWGSMALDNNNPGRIVLVGDIVSDNYFEVDLSTGAVGNSFGSPDNLGGGAFGNGASEAADTTACSGAQWVITSGTLFDGQVVRASQYDGTNLCYSTWDFAPTTPSGEFFINGFEEFNSSWAGEKRALCVGNVTSLEFILDKPLGIADCQGIDSPDSDVLYTNGDQGGGQRNVDVGVNRPSAHSTQVPPGGTNGKYFVHANTGAPNASTITTLPAALGDACFPVLIPPGGTANPVCIWNNIGKTNLIGSSNYFGTPIADPAKAPTFYQLLPSGDPVNGPTGSVFTLQGVIINLAATSPKLASITNAYTMTVVSP